MWITICLFLLSCWSHPWNSEKIEKKTKIILSLIPDNNQGDRIASFSGSQLKGRQYQILVGSSSSVRRSPCVSCWKTQSSSLQMCHWLTPAGYLTAWTSGLPRGRGATVSLLPAVISIRFLNPASTIIAHSLYQSTYTHKHYSICNHVILAKPQYEQPVLRFHCKNNLCCLWIIICLLTHMHFFFFFVYLLQISAQTTWTSSCLACMVLWCVTPCRWSIT